MFVAFSRVAEACYTGFVCSVSFDVCLHGARFLIRGSLDEGSVPDDSGPPN